MIDLTEGKMKLPEEEQESPLADVEELSAEPEDFGHSEETEESEELTKNDVMIQLDVFLNRLFRPGEFLPWKGVNFQVLAIKNGILALQARSMKQLPSARNNHGKRKSRSKQRSKKKVITIGG